VLRVMHVALYNSGAVLAKKRAQIAEQTGDPATSFTQQQQNKTKQNKTKQNKTKQNKTKQNKKQNKTKQNKKQKETTPPQT
jgi:hypothetical protein